MFAAVDRPAPDIPVTTTSRSGFGGEASVSSGDGTGSLAHRPDHLRQTIRLLITSPVAMLIASPCGAASRASLIASGQLGSEAGHRGDLLDLAARSFFSEPK